VVSEGFSLRAFSRPFSGLVVGLGLPRTASWASLSRPFGTDRGGNPYPGHGPGLAAWCGELDQSCPTTFLGSAAALPDPGPGWY
jgi:hypothetical protein